MNGDIINGLFELGGALAMGMSVRQLLKDRRYAGIHWTTTAFFQSWGLWNLWFYPSIGKPFSFYGGAALAAMNTAYLVLLWAYRPRQYDSGVFE